MKLSQFKFDLPLNLIAQHPSKKREDSRMMVVHRKTGVIENKHFRDILEYFDDKDVFVVNNTKVFPARMYGNKEKTGAKIEVFLLRELNAELPARAAHLFDVKPAIAHNIRYRNGTGVEEINGDLYFRAPNPPYGTTITFALPNVVSHASWFCISVWKYW